MINTLKELNKILIQTIKKDYNNNKFNLQQYKPILKRYNGNDWTEFIQIDSSHYSKCKVNSNDYFDMYIITWYDYQESKIHNHAEYGCLSKILTGELTEILYNYEDLNTPIEYNNVKVNEISYIDNTFGLHKIKNKNEDITVSLHIYSPPNFKTKFY